MVEGQHGLNWPRWKTVVDTVADAGFVGLFRSDHFTNPEGPVEDALELWTSLTWAADHTDRIDLGPLVTPVSFRHPVFTARMGKEVDNLADGRLVLGVGAGWQEREHEMFGFDLLPVPERFDRFEEGVTVIEKLLRTEPPVDFDGKYYTLDEAELRPRPERAGGTRLLVGGNGWNRTIPIAARVADEWNGVFLAPEDYADHVDRLEDCLADAGRDRAAMRRSLMTQVVFGRDEAELEAVLDGRDPEELRDHGIVVGTPATVGEHLDRLDAAGVDRVMLQWLDVTATDRLAAFGDVVN